MSWSVTTPLKAKDGKEDKEEKYKENKSKRDKKMDKVTNDLTRRYKGVYEYGTERGGKEGEISATGDRKTFVSVFRELFRRSRRGGPVYIKRVE